MMPRCTFRLRIALHGRQAKGCWAFFMTTTLGAQTADLVEVQTSASPTKLGTWTRVAWAFIGCGALLRVIWPLDMEWKFDERWMFDKAESVASGRDAWPLLGMPSGVGLENPGLSIWPFAALAHVFHDPVGMTEAVQWLNVFALFALALWVLRAWPAAQRELGLWSVALLAVSPLPVLFSRKIWAQDLLLVFVVPWLWGHAARKRNWFAAFAWGAFGGLLGQLHMSGFFAAASLLLATLIYDRRTFPWLPWLLGSAAASLSLMPWLAFVFSGHGAHASTAGSFSLGFFIEGLRYAWGLGLAYPLGRLYMSFLSGPDVAGLASHLYSLARYGLFALLGLGSYWLVRDRKTLSLSPELRVYFLCLLFGGLLLCLARVKIFPHYLIVWSPLLYVAAAWFLYRKRSALILLCSLQLLLSVGFLVFIHQHGGAPGADYGTAYRAQSAVERRALR
jgi:hypothetical protein